MLFEVASSYDLHSIRGEPKRVTGISSTQLDYIVSEGTQSTGGNGTILNSVFEQRTLNADINTCNVSETPSTF